MRAAAFLALTGLLAQDPAPAVTAADFWGLILERQKSGDAPGAAALVRAHAAVHHAESVLHAMLQRLIGMDRDGAAAPDRAAEAGSARFLADAATAAGVPGPAARLANYEAADPTARADWAACVDAYARGEALARDHNPVGAIEAYGRSQSLAERVGDAAFRVHALRGVALMRWQRREYAQAAAALRAAVATPDAAPWIAAEVESFLRDLEGQARRDGEPLLAPALADPANLGPEEVVRLEPLVTQGPPPFQSPQPGARENPWHWRQLWLEDGRPGTGAGVEGTTLLGFPGGLYLRKEFDTDVLTITAEPRTPGKQVRIGPKPELFRLKFPGTDGEYAFVWVRPAEWRVFGRRVVVGATKRVFDIRLRSATWRTGKTAGGKRLVLGDDNGNGQFDDLGADSIGEHGGRAAPRGCLVRLGDGWFHVTVDRAGREARLRRYTGPLGTLKVTWFGGEGSRLLWCAVEQKVGETRAYADVVGGEARLPVGTWFPASGVVVDGDDPEKARRIEFRRGTHGGAEVYADERAVLALGGPCTLAVPVVADGPHHRLATDQLVVSGAQGERWEAAWPDPITCDYAVLDATGAEIARGRTVAWATTETAPALGLLGFAKPVELPDLRGTPPFRTVCRGTHPLLGELRPVPPPAPSAAGG